MSDPIDTAALRALQLGRDALESCVAQNNADADTIKALRALRP